jgi:SAM-dependent methyltransferase
MWKKRLSWLAHMIKAGEFELLAVDAGFRVYKACYALVYKLRRGGLKARNLSGDLPISLQTKHPVAYESPDHQIPWGTAYDNSTNKRFILAMADRLEREKPGSPHGFLDLGCSGGQLVKDFKSLGWFASGLEGSDYSLKHGRANWPELGNKNLFTCDITKPFQLFAGGRPAKYDLITAWEVLEHIHPNDLNPLFENIQAHLADGGYFVASTTSSSDIHDGVELHQSRMTNEEWRSWIGQRYPSLNEIDLGWNYYHFVRFNYREHSFLTYQKRKSGTLHEP